MPYIPNAAQVSSGSGVILFDSTLGADAASIDTGAGGISGSYNVLEVFVCGYTDDAGAVANVDITVNDDVGSNYDYLALWGTNVTTGALPTLATTKWQIVFHGSGGSGAYPSTVHLIIPVYAGTTFGKVGNAEVAVPDGAAANTWNLKYGLGYRGAAAISRMKVAAQGAAKLKAGTRLLIYGR